jgi:hypothetical protein
MTTKQTEAIDTTSLTISRTLSAARWKKAEQAFYSKCTVKRDGTVENLRTAILAALKELLAVR